MPRSTPLNDRVNLDPRLAGLADMCRFMMSNRHGGPTRTFALAGGSPAIDQVTVNAASCAYTDKRGVPRPDGLRCDIGAYERDGYLLFGDGFE